MERLTPYDCRELAELVGKGIKAVGRPLVDRVRQWQDYRSLQKMGRQDAFWSQQTQFLKRG